MDVAGEARTQDDGGDDSDDDAKEDDVVVTKTGCWSEMTADAVVEVVEVDVRVDTVFMRWQKGRMKCMRANQWSNDNTWSAVNKGDQGRGPKGRRPL